MSTALADAPERTPQRQPRRRRFLIGVVTALVLVLAFLAWSWRTSPDTFGGYGNKIGAPLDVGRPLHAGITWESLDIEPHTVTLHNASARIVRNTADAEVSFSLCRAEKEPIGTASGRLERWCSEVLPIDDIEMTLNAEPRDSVLMTIRPTKPGVVRVRGADLTYTDGWQRGAEHIGSLVVVRAR
ncbi:MAG TPA: hypothetical protein VK964_03180 [Nocardioidaceae bacterium]|nr:hypothetical protein [Nocardioidaceae bacterium]